MRVVPDALFTTDTYTTNLSFRQCLLDRQLGGFHTWNDNGVCIIQIEFEIYKRIEFLRSIVAVAAHFQSKQVRFARFMNPLTRECELMNGG